MRAKTRKFSRSLVAMLLALCMIIGMVPATVFAAGETVKYVSFGDSMTNGFCFEGYSQGLDGKVEFYNGKYVYGEGSYPLQFAAWLESQGKVVDHTPMALSAMRAEDLNYLLGGRDTPADPWFYKCMNYGKIPHDQFPELSAFFIQETKEADIISLSMGNASFGAFFLERVLECLGVFGEELTEEEYPYMEVALDQLDANQRTQVMGLYNKLKDALVNKVPANIVKAYNLDVLCDLIAYITAGFMVNYRDLLDTIIAMNPDVEIIQLGFMNTTKGLTITGEGMAPIRLGEIMQMVYDMLNGYMVSVPTMQQSSGKWTEAKFYFAEQDVDEYIAQEFAYLWENNWVSRDNRLSAETVRDRNVDAYNDTLRHVIGQGVSGAPLAKITLEDVRAYEAIDWSFVAALGINPWGAFLVPNLATGKVHCTDQDEAVNLMMSVAIYLAMEDAVAMSMNTNEIPVTGLMKIAGNLASVFSDLGTPDTSSPEGARKWLANGMTSTADLRAMCKIYGLFKVGYGMAMHPTPASHDVMAADMIQAYKTGYSAQDQFNVTLTQLMDLLIKYGPWATEEFYKYADQVGLSTAVYKPKADSLYVALGDDSAVSASYVDAVAAELGVEYKNLSAKGSVRDAFEIIENNSDLIAKADLITVGYGNNTFTREAVNRLMAAIGGGEITQYDWEAYVGAKGAAYVKEALGEIEAMLVAKGMGEPVAALGGASLAGAMTLAVEAYAYAAVAYVYDLPNVIDEIRAINEDAVVIAVGMNNPFSNTTLTMNGVGISLGGYLDYLVNSANIHGLIYAMRSGNCIFVNCTDAQTDSSNLEVDAITFLMNYKGGKITGNPTAEGHAYIAQQILNSLVESKGGEGLYRLKGKNRYQTGFAVADELKQILGVSKFATVVVAYGEKFPDALTGSYLAGKYDAPILLTDKNSDNDVVDYIKENVVAGGKVYILGGAAAVSAEFEAAVDGAGFDVERLAGKNRFETNLAILREAGLAGAQEILVATGSNYADSLSASATGMPMLLVGDKLTAEQKTFLGGANGKFVILGGTAAVSEEVENELKAFGEVVRVKGSSRYETSIAIAERYFGAPSAAVLAYGEAFPDGLCGGPLAAAIGAPLVLTHNDRLSAADAYVSGVAYGYVTGGTARLSDAAVREIFDADAATEIVVKE